MNISPLLVPALSLSLLTSACARPSAAPPHVAKRVAPATVGIAYEVTKRVDGEGTIVSGHADLDPGDAVAVEQRSAKTGEKEDLKLKAMRRDDGTVLIEMRYAEDSATGGKILWTSSVRAARGTPAVADVSGAGWARSIRFQVE